MQSSECFHCQQSIPQGLDITLDIEGQQQYFCCYGCQMVAQTIYASGLNQFYQFRDQPLEKPHLDRQEQEQLLQLDEPLYLKEFARFNEQTQSWSGLFILEGVSCAACVWLIETRLKALPGVSQASVNLTDHRLSLTWHPDETLLSDIMASILQIGYRAHPYHVDTADQLQKKELQRQIMRLSLAALGMMQVMMFAVGLYSGQFYGIEEKHNYFLRWVSALITTPIVLFSAQPFFINAWRGLHSRHLNMDLPISIAIIGAYSASLWAMFTHGEEVYFDSVTMFIFFLLLGRFLEMRARHNTNTTVRNLMRINPSFATRIDADTGQHQQVPVNLLALGDRLLIKPGAQIPTDGHVVEGKSGVSESMLTGEFTLRPVSAAQNSQVFAGSQNSDSSLIIEVSAIGDETTLGNIIQLLNHVQQQKPKIAALADRISHYFVAGVISITVMVYLIWYWVDPDRAFWSALAVLVATCPCALSLATPTVITVAVNRLANKGILISKVNALPFFAETTDVVFDKTGTLTEGEFSVESVYNQSDLSKEKILSLCATLEQRSEHPIASAFQSMAAYPNIDVVNHPSEGVEAVIEKRRYRLGSLEFALENNSAVIKKTNVSINTRFDQPNQTKPIYLSENGSLVAIITLSDQLRPEAKTVTDTLSENDLNLHMITGDQQQRADQTLQQLPALKSHQANCSPLDKQHYIDGLKAEKRTITAIGDGINDTPILSSAHASIAMGSGTDLAKSSADAILLNNNLNHIGYLLQTSQVIEKRIRQNISWAICYNLSILPLAAMGWVPPYIAAAGMSLSSLLVVFNAMRIK